MMDNLTANKSHIPCQSWTGLNGWTTASAPGPLLNPPGSSQHLGLGSSPPDQTSSYDHLQVTTQSCMNTAHHSAMYKTSHLNNGPSPTSLFSNIPIPSASPLVSFAQPSPHASSALFTANQRKAAHPPLLPQPHRGAERCGSQHLPLLSSHDPYKEAFRAPLDNQGLPSGLQDLSMSLPSCGQHVNAAQDICEGADVSVSAGVAQYARSYGPSTSQEQPQWIPSSHCREAINKSFPDASTHPNNEPSQNNITPLPYNEKRRSDLLNQRAQLLKQLADMDKLLDSMPPEDNKEGQSLHTPIPSESHLSADCSSPASSGEHDEPCDMPEDPVSAETAEKKDVSSDESGDDSDPDYSPNVDGDLSDRHFDIDSSSSDESSHSISSTTSEEGPPSGKKAKSQKSFSTEKGAKKSANRKTFSDAVVLPTSNKKSHRVYKKRNYCLFCAKPQSKMARHLERIHCDKAEVAVAFQYPIASKERKKIWKKLINQGNFMHNKDIPRAGKRPRTPGQARDFLHCLYCKGLYMKKGLFKHMNICPEKEKSENEAEFGRKRIASRCALVSVGDLGISDGFKTIICEMIYDDVTQAVMDDKTLLLFGEQMFRQYGADLKKHNYIRQNLRQIARLVMEAQRTTPLRNLEDFFQPSSFRHVVSAVKVLAGYDPENKAFSIPSLAIKLGYHVQKACSIVESNAVKCGNANVAEAAKSFLKVYQKKWNRLVSSGALSTQREIKSATDKKVPFARDVKLLNSHLESVHLLAEKNLRDHPTAENYAALAKVMLARTIIFNRRKPGEVSTIELAAFLSRKRSTMPDDMDLSVTDLERTMCGVFTRVDIRGRCGRMVPVLFKPAFVSSLELLVDSREACGVPRKSPFLFGRPAALSSYKGSECVQQYVKECGAKNPEALTTRKIQKHCATMLQLMNLDEDEAGQILGPNHQAHILHQLSSIPGESVQREARSQPETGRQAANRGHTKVSSTNHDQTDFDPQEHRASRTVPPISVNSDSKGFQQKGKQKWDDAEVCAVERHMMRFIRGHKVPQKNDCIECLLAEPKALKTRSWKGVKDYVRNRITALKRQSGTPKATPAKGPSECDLSGILDVFRS